MNNFPDGLLWFPDSLSGKGSRQAVHFLRHGIFSAFTVCDG